ncbi:MAG TPA: AAA family ATPase [Solirubrobacteraceae bacterium]|nr:AAA family ATPase [Solirubrobacteraceae bacterium]
MQHTVTPGLLERERELEQLRALADDACAGRGRLAVVEGPPGIGKTRLLGVARACAGERDMAVLSARASELDRDFPFGIVRQLFEPLLAAAEPRRRARLLEGAAGLAAPLLGRGGEQPEAEEPAHFHALYWLTANLAAEGPALLAIDDLHWADPGSLRFLQFLLPRLGELPVLVAVAVRRPEPGLDGQPIDVLATDPLAVVLRPAPLSERAVAELAGELGDAAEEAFIDACRQATGGNPFLLRELLHELAADGVAPTAAGVPLVRQLAPPTVARAVLLRLARLGNDATALARAVAVLGDDVPLRRAAALAGIDEDRASDLAAALAQAHILAPARPLAFAHPILRAAIYSDSEPGQLATAHRRAADLLVAEGAGADAVAVHLLATEPAGDPYVVATLRDAAARAAGRGAARTGVACLRRALAEPPPPEARGPLAFELASAEVRAGEPRPAAEHFAEGMRVTSDPRTRAAYARDQATALIAADRGEEAQRLLEEAVRDVEPVDPELALTIEATLLGFGRTRRERLSWVRERLEARRDRLTGATAGERLMLAIEAHLDAFSGSSRKPASALADAAERALADGRLVAEARGEAPPLFFALDVLLLADRLEPARRMLDQAVDDARRQGSAPAFSFASGMRCGLMAREGDLAAAEADGRSCAELAIDQGWFIAQPNGIGSLISVLVDRGELDDAEHMAERSREAERRGVQALLLGRVIHARARVLVARGDLAGARAELERLGRPKARWNTYPTLVPPVLVAPQLAPEDPDEARAAAERTLAEAHAWGTPRAIGMALHAAALAEAGPRRLELLEAAASALAGSPARLEHARALCDLGAALRRTNRRTAARDPLRRALDLADACGARPLAERARQELRAAGGRPRRPRVSGVDALTASERRIAGMAADGMSNPEIAQALFVTIKTVEAHLSNAYRKLDIRSRAQLRGALRS